MIDAAIDPADGFQTDRLRIRIWEEVGGTEHVVYDTAVGSDDESAMTEIGGGSIVKHK